MQGIVGKLGQKFKLSFSSLAVQIENVVKRGYSKAGIIAALIKPVSLDLQLRSYLEGKSGLSLTMLRGIQRSHFQENDVTALFHSLSNSCRQTNETPQDFYFY